MLSHFLLITGLVKFFNESPEPESGFRLRISVRYGNPGTPNRPPRALATSILTVYRIYGCLWCMRMQHMLLVTG